MRPGAVGGLWRGRRALADALAGSAGHWDEGVVMEGTEITNHISRPRNRRLSRRLLPPSAMGQQTKDPCICLSTMARSYGIAPTDRDDTVADNDNAPLLGAGPPKAVEDEQEDGHATIVSCVGNLANTIMGTGMLTFPLVSSSPIYLLLLQANAR